MSTQKQFSQIQIIKKINIQTRKSYKLFDELSDLRPSVSRVTFDHYQESTTPVSRTLVSGGLVSIERKLKK